MPHKLSNTRLLNTARKARTFDMLLQFVDMKKLKLSFLFILVLSASSLLAQNQLDRYVLFPKANKLVALNDSAGLITSPVDLDFHPDTINRRNELWILNQGTNTTGGSTVIFNDVSKKATKTQLVQDGNAWHFMALSSALSFGENGNWATAQDIEDANRAGGNFTGPSLWSSDLKVYGVIGNPPSGGTNGSRIDDVHQSPFGKGITWEKDNVYWIVDGYDNTLKRYDFKKTNTPGKKETYDADVHVYTDYSFKRNQNLPAHIVIGDSTKWLYGCDTEGKRVFRIDITSGKYSKALSTVTAEPLGSYNEYTGHTEQTILDTALSQPVGIDIHGNRLIVSDFATEKIILFDLKNMKELGKISFPTLSQPGIKGVKFGPDGNIYFVDDNNNKVYRIENDSIVPKQCSVFSKITAQACKGYLLPSGSRSITQSGTYFDTLKSIDGCDSIIEIALSIDTIKAYAAINNGANHLYTTAAKAKYQWLSCLPDNSFSEVANATDSVFRPGKSGSYAVRVAGTLCVDTSDCIDIVVLATSPYSVAPWSIYPNPADEQIWIETPLLNGELQLTNTAGQVLYRTVLTGNKQALDIKQLPMGLYHLKLITEEYTEVKKIVKR